MGGAASVAPSTGEVTIVSRGDWERITPWRDLVPGDKLVVNHPRWPQYRGITFEFIAFIRNKRSGTEHVEVYGGRRGYEHVTAFNPQYVSRQTRS